MKNDKNFLTIFIKKYCYVVMPALLSTMFFIVDVFNLSQYFSIFDLSNSEKEISTIISMSGTLIGFLFTSMTIFFSLNKDSQYMQNFKRYGHHIIFCRLISAGIIFLFLNIMLWMFNINIKYVILSFVLGFVETIMASYYTYKLSLNSLK